MIPRESVSAILERVAVALDDEEASGTVYSRLRRLESVARELLQVCAAQNAQIAQLAQRLREAGR